MFLIRSGIPSLDGMLRPSGANATNFAWNIDQCGIYLARPSGTTSICIAGPDGTGKSALAMHFASRYLADCDQFCEPEHVGEPLAFYVSSDLSYEKASGMWDNFRLSAPNTRRIPFRYPQIGAENSPSWLRGEAYDPNLLLTLEPYIPEKVDVLAEHIRRPETKANHIGFIDLASHTAGDDWGFIERLLATMPTPSSDAPRHLLVIDAMEGMETLAGDMDAFGQKTTRRGRVAKLMRLAGPKCHLVLVIEEPTDSVRLAEQFVADVVLRLRATEGQGYTRRTIEIEKARGQSHVRGRHPYVIRDGRGSTTGEQINFDDPRVDLYDRSQSYIDVFPSLHSLSRAVMENRAPGIKGPSKRRAGFGITGLDEMLATRPKGDSPEVRAQEEAEKFLHGQDPRGLPCGTVSALIGDANTQKSFLGLAFLGHVFHELAWEAVSADADPLDERVKDWLLEEEAEWHYADHIRNYLDHEKRRWLDGRLEQLGRGHAGAAVLITTKDESNRTLAERFCDQLQTETRERALRVSTEDAKRVATVWKWPTFRAALSAYLQSRTICRRLEIHDTPSAILVHAIRRSVEAAQQIVKYDYADACEGRKLSSDAAERAEYGWRIRFVLDDFNSVMRTYGRVHDDPLFLPFLLLSLRREGISALIIETQSGTHGMPALGLSEDAQSDLRALSDYRLFTWHVPNFFGDHRIAIAAIPPMVQQDRKSPVLVRELEWYPPSSTSVPRVNPRFELYAGLDTNKPTMVPLQVHLYAETDAWRAYIERLDQLWRRVFDPPSPELNKDRGPVVLGETLENYELMRDVCDLHANTNLDYSLLVQVDEFWRHRDTFRSQMEYLTRPIDEPMDVEDGGERTGVRIVRAEWFDAAGYGLPSKESPEFSELDRVPFVWDFGFLACRERLWNEATRPNAEARGEGTKSDLAKMRRKTRHIWNRMREGQSCKWVDVLESASYVAMWETARQSKQVHAFDLAMVAPQTFACLVLEIWFSEIYDKHRKKNPNRANLLIDSMKTRVWSESRSSELVLAKLAKEFWQELYCTWLLLAEVLDLNAFDARKEGFGFRFGRKADPNAVVTREWYKSAAFIDSGADAGPVRFCRLPGHFSVRGDWFLAAVRGSRSDRLADRALDLLSSTEANVDRLMRGLGLPTRTLADSDLSTRLRGWHRDKHETGTLTYANVLSLGASEANDFHWLWRGNLEHYYAAAPIWERWLFRVLRRWKRTREFVASNWISGFDLYRAIKLGGKPFQKAKELVSYKDFQEMIEVLCEELKGVESSDRKLHR